jgi:phosphoglycolate phosphatase-like HAD superfamily hydrolase
MGRRKDRGKAGPAFLFDLDGTLVDSVYQHVLAWREALEAAGIELAVWRIHRRFLEAAGRLGVVVSESVVVGDSVWDMLAARRARSLGVGLLSGGYGQDELERGGAYRVYQDLAGLLRHLDEVGVRAAE